jgi:hypothetical protein
MLASLLLMLPKLRPGSLSSIPIRMERSLLENSLTPSRLRAQSALLPALFTSTLPLTQLTPLTTLDPLDPLDKSQLMKRNLSSTLSGFLTTTTPTRMVSSIMPKEISSGTTSPPMTTQVNSLPKLVRFRLGSASLTPTRTAN